MDFVHYGILMKMRHVNKRRRSIRGGGGVVARAGRGVMVN
jgi:hypothetical protein